MTLIMPLEERSSEAGAFGEQLKNFISRAEKIISPENFSTESDKCINNDSVDKERKCF